MIRRPTLNLPAGDSASGVLYLGLLLAVLAYVLPLGVRWVTVPLVFFVPGNAVVSALFGRHLEFGGVRRAGLCGVMSLVAYAIVGLAVFGMGFRMSHVSVVVSVAGLSSLCATIIVLRTSRWPAFRIARHEEYKRRISPTEVALPVVSIAAALLVAYASVQVLPRKPADEYTAIAFDGTWALTNRIVRVDPSRDVQVQYQVMNRTRSDQVYRVTTSVLYGSVWESEIVRLAPGEDYQGSASGKVNLGSCSSRLEVLLEQEGAERVRDPLVLYFRDSGADC